jgi:Leucine-rich repeat (LRR) protein
MITKIQAGTFSCLKSLETLDLRTNGIRIVPAEIFNLPNLKKLYLAENDLTISGFAEIKKPVAAPLMYLNIASTEVDRIPDLGVLPDLEILILADNDLRNIAPEQFAPFCELTFVDLNKTNIGSCQCHRINLFMSEKMKKAPMLICGDVPSRK